VQVGRWICILLLVGAGAGTVLSCGRPGGSDAPTASDASLPEAAGGFGFGGEAGACKPKACAELGYTCGVNSDGCGNTVDCGTCPGNDFCGGGGFSKCGTNGPDGGPISNCTPATCASLGYNCGQAGDGCGGAIRGGCGTCSQPLACGAGGRGGVCGRPCTGLCAQQVACDGGATTISGTVVAGTPAIYLPAGVTAGDPVPNVLVYVPNGPVQAFAARASETAAQLCSTCGADVTGNPLVMTTTNFDGTFSLANVPVGNGIPVVIQLGRWRREFTVDIPNACAENQVGNLTMPHNHGEGDIPLTALSTGQVDSMECVLLKMGIDATEFTTNTANPNGRIHIYRGNGASVGGGTPDEPALMETGGTFNNYDQIILPCWGVDPVTDVSNQKTPTELADLVAYADAGGHFFATHFSYTWLYENAVVPPPATASFQSTAAWNVNANAAIDSMTGRVSPSVPPAVPAANPGTFVRWLNFVQALSNVTNPPPPPNPALVAIANARHDVDGPLGQSVGWIDGNDPLGGAKMLLHYTFDTPVGQTSGQCGHAIYSDFHVTNQSDTSGFDFSNDTDRDTECGTNPMTPQEKILEYMIWDLASCVPGPPPPTCTPVTCQQQSIACGPASDGCGNLIPTCGTCAPPQTCGGGGVSGQCGGGATCLPKTCQDLGLNCGPAGDGCGHPIPSCGTCAPPAMCGAGGMPGHCPSLLQ
jgi:hypothetical protein